MSFEEQEKVYEKLQNAYETYETLTEEEKSQLTGTDAFDELFDYFNGMVSAAGNEGSNGLEVTSIDGNVDYDYTDNILTIKNTRSGTIKISGSGTTTDRIVVEGGNTVNTVNIILDNVNIQQSSPFTCAFLIKTGASVNLTLVGENVLQSGESHVGLQVEGTLNITGGENGSLQATGGLSGAGIGGGYNGAGGTIVIIEGEVKANAGHDTEGFRGAGIGNGWGNNAANKIVINGGIVTANSFKSDVADIGNSNTIFSTTISYAGGNSVLGSAVITCKTGGIKDSLVSDGQCIIINEPSNTCMVYGNMTLKTGLTIQKSYKMTVPQGNSLIISKGVTLTNNGTI